MEDFGGLGDGEVSALFTALCFVYAVDFDACGTAEGDDWTARTESNCSGWVVYCADVVEEVTG
jgi:hypothetical protein